MQVIISFRHASQGLLLSELGGYLLSPAQAQAGTKRISNLLRSRRWGYQFSSAFSDAVPKPLSTGWRAPGSSAQPTDGPP